VSGYSTPRSIGSEDDIGEFDSGEPTLDDWLRKRALANQATGASRCFVTCRDGRVVGYYALATGSVQHLEASRRIGQGMPDPIPVVLLGRLAVDQKEQGRRLGSNLLRDAIARTVEAAEVIGIRALLVHALHERARDFYLHYDFEPSPTDPLHLMLLMKDARKIVRGQA
jgi:GNAT superfamily N-acetyltransferase